MDNWKSSNSENKSSSWYAWLEKARCHDEEHEIEDKTAIASLC